MLKRLVYILFIPAIFSLAACQDYDFKVNDKVVYSPALYREYTTPDQGLRECLQQTIKDRGVTEPQQLDILDCSSAGIQSLEGISVFTGLIAARFSDNEIRNLVELGAMDSIEVLYLDDNEIIDPVPLYRLPALRELELSGNAALQCPKSGSLEQVATLVLPTHCN